MISNEFPLNYRGGTFFRGPQAAPPQYAAWPWHGNVRGPRTTSAQGQSHAEGQIQGRFKVPSYLKRVVVSVLIHLWGFAAQTPSKLSLATPHFVSPSVNSGQARRTMRVPLDRSGRPSQRMTLKRPWATYRHACLTRRQRKFNIRPLGLDVCRLICTLGAEDSSRQSPRGCV